VKRTKQDRQFWIQFDLANRDFLSNTSALMLSYGIALISLLISVIAVIIAMKGPSAYTTTIVVVLAAIAIIAAWWFSIKVKRMIVGAREINEQLQKELFELYPEYRKRIH